MWDHRLFSKRNPEEHQVPHPFSHQRTWGATRGPGNDHGAQQADVQACVDLLCDSRVHSLSFLLCSHEESPGRDAVIQDWQTPCRAPAASSWCDRYQRHQLCPRASVHMLLFLPGPVITACCGPRCESEAGSTTQRGTWFRGVF